MGGVECRNWTLLADRDHTEQSLSKLELLRLAFHACFIQISMDL
jgi:hypothetical protein